MSPTFNMQPVVRIQYKVVIIILSLLLEIPGTVPAFHTKRRNPPRQEPLVWERLVLPLLGRTFSSSFGDCGVGATLLLLLLEGTGDTWGRGGAAGPEPDCRASLFCTSSAIHCAKCAAFCKNKPWTISHTVIFGHFLKWWQLPPVTHSFWVFLHMLLKYLSFLTSLSEGAPLFTLRVSLSQRILTERLREAGGRAGNRGHRRPCLSWGLHPPPALPPRSSLSDTLGCLLSPLERPWALWGNRDFVLFCVALAPECPEQSLGYGWFSTSQYIVVVVVGAQMQEGWAPPLVTG